MNLFFVVKRPLLSLSLFGQFNASLLKKIWMCVCVNCNPVRYNICRYILFINSLPFNLSLSYYYYFCILLFCWWWTDSQVSSCYVAWCRHLGEKLQNAAVDICFVAGSIVLFSLCHIIHSSLSCRLPCSHWNSYKLKTWHGLSLQSNYLIPAVNWRAEDLSNGKVKMQLVILGKREVWEWERG